MKLDSHCNIQSGFDIHLKCGHELNCISVPSRYHLNLKTWKKNIGPIDYTYLKYPKNLEKEIGFRNNRLKMNKLSKNKMIDNIITFQGSCWFMEKDFFEKIGKLDSDYFGSLGTEAQELSMKTWLCNDGRVIRNKNVWYSHYQRKSPITKQLRNNMIINMQKTFSMCMLDKWPNQKKPFKWLIDKLGPFPGWPDNWYTKEYINSIKKYLLI